MFQQAHLFSILALFVCFIPGYTLAGAATSRVVSVEQHPVSVNQTSSVDQITKSLGDDTVNTTLSAKAFMHKMDSMSMEMLEEIMSEQWKSSVLASLPVEMLPLLKGLRNVTVNNITSFSAVFNALHMLQWIDLTPLNWKKISKHEMKLMLQMLSKIIDRQPQPPKVVGDINKFYIAAIKQLYPQYDIIRVLLSTPSLFELIEPAAGNNFAIRFASEHDDIEVVKSLLNDSRVNPAAGNNYAIRYASRNGHSEVVKLLLNTSRVDPTARYNYAIQYASANGHAEVVKLLMKVRRVNPAAECNYALLHASENGYSDVVELLLKDRRVDPTAFYNYAIRYAALNGHTDVIKLLLKDGRVDPATDNNVAIRFASMNGHTEVVQLLLNDRRVNPAAVNNEAIRMAKWNGHTEVVELLLKDRRVMKKYLR